MHRSVSAKSFPSPMKSRNHSDSLGGYHSLSLTTAQLHAVTDELELVNKQRTNIAAVNGQIRRQIAKTISDCQALKKNHEKLHNESMKLSKATDRLITERALMEKECQLIRTEIATLDQTLEREKKEIQRLKGKISEETTVTAGLNDLCAKIRKELERKTKEKRALKANTLLIMQDIEARGLRHKVR